MEAELLPAMLSVREVAVRLAVSPDTVRRLATDGQLSAVRVGGQLRFEADDVASFIAAHRVRSPYETQ